MHQERAYPGRVIATDLVNPDFAALAAAHGLFARKVTTTEAFAPALTEALGCGEPALIEVITNPDTLLPGVTVAGLRALSRS
jgi:acetolactate synthase-1/2/3 large subunit